MPYGPNHAAKQTAEKPTETIIEPRQQEATPADLFAQSRREARGNPQCARTGMPRQSVPSTGHCANPYDPAIFCAKARNPKESGIAIQHAMYTGVA